MSALQVLIDGFLTAAELVALLFVSPVSAMDQPRTEQGPGAPAIESRQRAWQSWSARNRRCCAPSVACSIR